MRLKGTSFFILAMAGLGGLLYGVDFGVIAAAEPYLMALGLYSGTKVSLVVGAVLVGGLLASLTAGVLCDWLGRKKTIVLSAAMFLAAIPVVCLALGNFPILFAGRVLQGMSAGYMAAAMPMYLTETLPAEIRGRGTGVFQTCLGIGLVVAAGAGCLIASVMGASDKAGMTPELLASAWRTNFWWTMAPVALLFVGSFFLKESPVWKKKVSCFSFLVSCFSFLVSRFKGSASRPAASNQQPETRNMELCSNAAMSFRSCSRARC